MGFGTKFVDFNLDGWLDIFIVNGHVIDNIAEFNKGYTHAQKKQLFINQTDGTFKELENAGDIRNKSVGRGAAFGDIDNDGDMDIVISNNNSNSNLLINLSKPGNNWINVELEGVTCNRDAIGSKLELKSKSGTQVAWVNPGASYLASNDKRILFGLSKDMYVDNLIIHWPDGQKESFNNLEVNIFYHIRQGSGISIINH